MAKRWRNPIKMPSKPPRSAITLDIPPELLNFCDQRAKLLSVSRSAFIRLLIVQAREAAGQQS
jgi:hypothetical protein